MSQDKDNLNLLAYSLLILGMMVMIGYLLLQVQHQNTNKILEAIENIKFNIFIEQSEPTLVPFPPSQDWDKVPKRYDERHDA